MSNSNWEWKQATRSRCSSSGKISGVVIHDKWSREGKRNYEAVRRKGVKGGHELEFHGGE